MIVYCISKVNDTLALFEKSCIKISGRLLFLEGGNVCAEARIFVYEKSVLSLGAFWSFIVLFY